MSRGAKTLFWLALTAPAIATPATVAGRLGGPTGSAPAQTVYAWSTSARHLYSVFRPAGSQQYLLELPPGRYFLFTVPEEAGAPPVYGAYTPFARCAHDTATVGANCDSHALLEVDLHGRRVAGIDLIDWSLRDDTAAQLDGLLGRPSGETVSEAELAAPKFSEYPAAPPAGYHAPALELADSPRGTRDQAVLRAAQAAHSPNFAGDFVLLRIDCGAGCEDVALLDLRSGKADYPAMLNPLPPAAPCTAQGALQFRADSRLLTVTSREGADLATRYLLLAPEGDLRPLATLTRAVAERCAEPAPP